jgi:uncharacterized protein DUF1360
MAANADRELLATIETPFAGYSDEEKPLLSYAALIGVFNLVFAAALFSARASGRELPARISASDILLFGTATHKLSRLMAKDKVTSVLRAPFTRYEGQGGPAEIEEEPRGKGMRRALGELLLCPYCLDQWVATGFVTGAMLAPRLTRLVASTFTVVALADFLQIVYKRGQQKL